MNLQTALLDPDLRGHAPLWRVFWIEGVALSHALFAAIVMAYAQVSSAALAVALLGFMAYTAWILRRIWINAGNTDRPALGDLARFLTVAWAINAALVSLFMGLAHFSGEPFPLPF